MGKNSAWAYAVANDLVLDWDHTVHAEVDIVHGQEYKRGQLKTLRLLVVGCPELLLANVLHLLLLLPLPVQMEESHTVKT